MPDGPTQLLLVVIAKSLVEIAGALLLGQGILYVLAGKARHANPFYQFMQTLTRPVLGLVRAITPRLVLERHIPLVAALLLFWLWVLLTIAKTQLCLLGHGQC